MRNIIDITLTAEQKAAMSAAVEAVAPAMPFLRSFSLEERKTLFRMGPRRQTFARLALELARQETEYLPGNFNLPGMERDMGLFDTLTPIRAQLAILLQQVTDTQLAAGTDLCVAGLEVYRALRGHARDAGFDTMVAELGLSLRRRPVPAAVPAAPVEGGTPAVE